MSPAVRNSPPDRPLDLRLVHAWALFCARIGAAGPRVERIEATERVTWRWKNGVDRLVIESCDGRLHGTWTERRRDGKLACMATFEHGVLHGRVERRRRDGSKVYVGNFERGAKSGEWFYMERDGSMDRARTGVYQNGLRISGIRGFNEWLGSP